MRLSVLIFSMNEPKKALKLVRSIYQITDDIVLVDSSDPANFRRLIDEKEDLHLTRLHIYYVHPLGYVEPFRMYGLSKCKNEWVLYLDVDENINDELENGLVKLLNERGDKYDAFAIVRENFLDGKRIYGNYGIKLPKNDYHVRLYKKSKTEYAGIIHEAPLIDRKPFSNFIKNERICKLDSKFKIIQNHRSEDYFGKFVKYMKLEIFQRRDTYAQMTHYIPKSLMPLFMFYLHIKNKSLNDELTKFDYKTKERIALLRQTRNPLDLILPLDVYFDTKIKIIFGLNEDLRKTTFKISKEINAHGGTISYLGLNTTAKMERFSKKYRLNTENPLDLLNLLLLNKVSDKSMARQKQTINKIYKVIIKFSYPVKHRLINH